MAEFKEAFRLTMAHEGGYSKNAVDVGGESYKGISRRYNPGWEGWAVIDAAKRARGFPRSLEAKRSLQAQVERYYKQHYWDKFWGDVIPRQDVANELFDTGVNLGVQRAVEFLQQALNVLNRNGRLYADLVVDGVFGGKSIAALRAYLKKDKSELLLKIMNVLQGVHYVEFMSKSPLQERFARGWFQRVEIRSA